jgi:hypothetical protein
MTLRPLYYAEGARHTRDVCSMPPSAFERNDVWGGIQHAVGPGDPVCGADGRGAGPELLQAGVGARPDALTTLHARGLRANAAAARRICAALSNRSSRCGPMAPRLRAITREPAEGQYCGCRCAACLGGWLSPRADVQLGRRCSSWEALPQSGSERAQRPIKPPRPRARTACATCAPRVRHRPRRSASKS